MRAQDIPHKVEPGFEAISGTLRGPRDSKKNINEKERVLLTPPQVPGIMDTEAEIRYDLPFDVRLGNLAYIGIVRHETWFVGHHIHSHFELCYVEEGQGYFTIEDAYYEVREGDLFLTKPGEMHQGAAKGDSPFRLYYLGFQLEQLRSLEVAYYNIGMNRAENDREGTVKRISDAIFAELRSKGPFSKQMTEGLLMQMLVAVLRIYQGGGPGIAEPPKRLSSSLIQLLNQLHEDIRANHDVEELARSLHMSRSHLAREFKRQMGVTLGSYIRSLCIDKAKHSLRESDDTVSAIADRLRFTSIHTFSIFFKRHVGISPQEYRNQ